VIFGGVGEKPQINMLRRGVDIIIATPGRLLDLMRQGHVDLTLIEMLVLDEADRMLDMGFINDIRQIVAKLNARRQTLLFSATMPKEIRQLASTLMRNPAIVEVAPPATTVTAIDQSVYFVDKQSKPELLARLVKDLPMHRAIVFTRTKHGADRVVRHLDRYGIRSMAIHGNKSQNVRERALADFRNNKTHVLVATDIASRGIDVDGVTHVVNYDLTHEPETYVHRIGRTARAGAAGAAVAFCDPEEMQNLRAIERLMRKSIPVKTHQIRKGSGENSAAPVQPAHPTDLAVPLDRAATPPRRHETHPIEKRRSSQGPNGHRKGGSPPAGNRTNGAHQPKVALGGGSRPQANGRPGHPTAPKVVESRRPRGAHPMAAKRFNPAGPRRFSKPGR
jgi:ATP-dependent RNA helicase RhlE